MHFNTSAAQKRESKPCHECGQKVYTEVDSFQTDEVSAPFGTRTMLYFHHENPRIAGNRNCWNRYKDRKEPLTAGPAQLAAA